MPVTEELAVRGFADFDEMCVTCHGAPGKERSEIGKGLNPPPPDLATAARRWSDAELFWIIKNGVRMTGMPAFGKTHDDERIWALATVVRQLPDMTAERYAERTRTKEQPPDKKQPPDTARAPTLTPDWRSEGNSCGRASRPQDHTASGDNNGAD